MTYKGHIAEIKFDGGLSGKRILGRTQPNRLEAASNISLDTPPTIRHTDELKRYNSTAITGLPVILAGHDWWPSAGVHRTVIVANDGKIYKDTYDAGTFATTLHNYGGSLTGAHMPTFIEGGKEVAANNRKLFIMVRDQIVQVLSGDGAVTANIATPPADWTGSNQPICGAIHEGRLWGAGNPNDPHRVYYSTTGNHEDFTGAGSGSLSIYPGDGEKIVDIASFKGLLIVWKYPKGIFFIDTTDPTIANWKVKILTKSVGGVSPTGAAIVDDDMIFIDSAADIYLLSSVQEFGDVTSRSLTKLTNMQEYIRGSVFAGMPNMQSTQCVYYSPKREVHFALPNPSGVARNDQRIAIDFNAEIPRFIVPFNPTTCSIWNAVDSDGNLRILAGDGAGFVNKLDYYQIVLSPDGTFTAGFRTIPTDFSHIDPALALRRKNGEFLEFIVTNYLTDTDNTLTIRTYWDDRETDVFTIVVPVSDFGVGPEFQGRRIRNFRRRITGGGRFFAYSVGSTTGMNIIASYISFSVDDNKTI